MARTSTRPPPEPKLATTSGAYTVASWAPNWPRTAGVAITSDEPRGSRVPASSVFSRAAGNPSCRSRPHTTGSQDTTAPGLTCRAVQAAACRWAADGGAGGGPGRVRTATATAAPAATRVPAAPSAIARRPGRRRGMLWSPAGSAVAGAGGGAPMVTRPSGASWLVTRVRTVAAVTARPGSAFIRAATRSALTPRPIAPVARAASAMASATR
jgi:hypothetical protein